MAKWVKTLPQRTRHEFNPQSPYFPVTPAGVAMSFCSQRRLLWSLFSCLSHLADISSLLGLSWCCHSVLRWAGPALLHTALCAPQLCLSQGPWRGRSYWWWQVGMTVLFLATVLQIWFFFKTDLQVLIFGSSLLCSPTWPLTHCVVEDAVTAWSHAGITDRHRQMYKASSPFRREF